MRRRIYSGTEEKHVNEIPEPPSRAGEVLRAVHRSPGIPRAELAARAGLSSGLASDLVARLVGEGWLSEGEPAAAAGRGRPTRTLWPHPDGPLVAAVAISHETWRIELCELGGGVVECAHAAHERRCEPVCRALAGALEVMWRTHGPRIHAIAVSAPGIVSGTRLVQAPNLGWQDVELAALRPSEAVAAGIGFHAGNDANDSAVAELARGAAEGLSAALVVFMDSGVGGALIDCGRVTQGAHGMSGEFGHLPLGSRRVRCRCGAAGCWNTELDGAAVARLLGRRLADDLTGGGVERDLPGAEQQSCRLNGMDVGTDRLWGIGSGQGLAICGHGLPPWWLSFHRVLPPMAQG
jgi:hypothetical protein